MSKPKRRRRTRATKLTAGTALAGVSGIAGITSYLHGVAVTRLSGATAPVTYLVPFLADLVILGASADLLDASRAGARRPPLAMVALAAGITVTAVMNVAAGWPHGWGGRLVAGWPALAFVLALESLAGLVRRGRGGDSRNPAPATCDTGDTCLHGPPESAAEALRILLEHGRDCLGEPVTYKEIGDALGIDRRKVAGLVKVPAPAAPAPSLNGVHADA